MRDRTTTSSSFRPKRESARFESTDCLMRWPGASWRNPCATQCTRLIGLERWSLKWLRVNSKTGTIEALMQMAARCSPIRHEAEDLVHDVLLAAIEKGRDCGDSKAAGRAIRARMALSRSGYWLRGPKSVAGSRFSFCIEKRRGNQLLKSGLRSGPRLPASRTPRKRRLQHRHPAHFLRILSMAFPLASSSTSLSK